MLKYQIKFILSIMFLSITSLAQVEDSLNFSLESLLDNKIVGITNVESASK